MGNGTSPKDAIEGIPSQEELLEHIKRTRPTSDQNRFQWIVDISFLVLFLVCEYFTLTSLFQALSNGSQSDLIPYIMVFAGVTIWLVFASVTKYLRGKFVSQGLAHVSEYFNYQVYCKHNNVIYVFGAPRWDLHDFKLKIESIYLASLQEIIFEYDLAKESNAWTAFRMISKNGNSSNQSSVIENILSGKIHVHSQKPILPEEKAGS